MSCRRRKGLLIKLVSGLKRFTRTDRTLKVRHQYLVVFQIIGWLNTLPCYKICLLVSVGTSSPLSWRKHFFRLINRRTPFVVFLCLPRSLPLLLRGTLFAVHRPDRTSAGEPNDPVPFPVNKSRFASSPLSSRSVSPDSPHTSPRSLGSGVGDVG